MSGRSLASPSASTAILPTMMPPASLTSSSIARSDSPVEITSSTMTMRLPWISSASVWSSTSVCTPCVVMDLTCTWNTLLM